MRNTDNGHRSAEEDTAVLEGTAEGENRAHETRRPRSQWTFNYTDVGNAQRLVDAHGASIIYCPSAGGWRIYDGTKWKVDDVELMEWLAKETVARIFDEAWRLPEGATRTDLLKHAVRSEGCQRIKAMVTLAESEPGIPIVPAQLDTDPFLLNCHNGTVDLRTGELQPHRREDLITKLAPVDYDFTASSRLWDGFLDRVTGGSQELRNFLQRAAGYSLTGSTAEEKLFLVHGPGASGKTSFIEALKAAMGDYAVTADFETFIKRRDVGTPRNDVARLAGARLVVSVEVEEGRHLAEGLVKLLVGGDTVAARFLFREAFEFVPAFKLWLVANHAPRVGHEDDAMWRRILLVPFPYSIPKDERDPEVKERLRHGPEVKAAVLAWAVQGCLWWQSSGLGVPPVVETATEAYREEMDPLAEWLADCCELAPDAWALAGALRESYEGWAGERGERGLLRGRAWGQRLRAAGCTPATTGGGLGRGWRGIRLKG